MRGALGDRCPYRDLSVPQWLEANRRVLGLRRQVIEAEKEAAALRKVLDALEAVAPGLNESESVPSPRKSSSVTILRLTEVLKAQGPMTARQLAEATGFSYFTVNTNLRKGPFQAAGTVKVGRRTAQTWKVADADTEDTSEAPGEVGA